MQRPSADMLLKDKWLAKLKVPNSVLRDLIPSYRQSLPGLDPQSEQYVPNPSRFLVLHFHVCSFSESFVRPESWTFSNEDEDFEDSGGESEFDSSTVHPISNPLPRSLKGLFNEVEHNNINAPTMLSNSFLPDDSGNHSTVVSRSRRLPSPIPPMPPSPYPPSPTPPSSTPPVYLSRPPPKQESTPPSHPTTPPSIHTTAIHLTGAHANTSSSLTPIPTPRRSPVSISETSSSEGGSYQQMAPRAFQALVNNYETTTTPFSPSSSSSSKSSHRMQTITGRAVRRDDPSTWKFPSAGYSGRQADLPNLGLGLVRHFQSIPNVSL
jgi:hypothetical protein